MSRLLNLVEREVKKVQAKHEEINDTDELQIFLDWGRDGKEDLQLLTIVSASKRIVREMSMKHNN